MDFGKLLLVSWAFFHLKYHQQYLRGIFAAVGLREYQMCPAHRINVCMSSLEPEEEK